MKICVLSDSHDNRVNLEKAAIGAKEKGAECVVHCGDVVSSSTLNFVLKHNLSVHVIYGNNRGDLTMMGKMAANPDNHLHFYGQDADITLGGKRFFIVHYPHYAEAMALTGRYDVVCCGHSHNLLIKNIKNIQGGKTLYIDAGNTAGIAEEGKYVMLDTKTLDYQVYTI